MISNALIVTSLSLLLLSFRVNAQLTPAAPTNLKAVAKSDTEVTLTWNDNSSNENLFIIERSVSNQNNYGIISTVTKNVKTFTDQFAGPKTKYFYRVKARNITFFGNRDSGYSNVSNTTTPGPPSPPSALNASTLSKTSIRVNWNAGSNDTDKYRIERSKNNNNNNFAFVANVNANKKEYVDDDLNSNTRYHYRVRGFNDYGNSTFSNKDSDVTYQYPPTLSAIADPDPIIENAGKQTINLRGITAGGNESQTLTVKASSNNKNLIPDPSVIYSSPNANGSISYTPVGGTFGTATITVTVEDNGPSDPPDNINKVTRNFTVRVDKALPDFIIQNPVVPELICVGQAFQVSCEVKNKGFKQAPASELSIYFSATNNTIDDGDALLSTVPIPALNKNETVPIAVDVNLEQQEGGPYYIIFKMDHNNEVEEIEENNNANNVEFNLCLPDLSIENHEADKTLLSRGQHFNVTYDLVNSGDIEANAQKITYYLAKDQQTLGEDMVIGESNIASLGEGETRSIEESLTIPPTTEDGNYFLVFRADSENEVIEKNEDNNIAVTNITIQNLPDVNILTSQIDPVLVAFGQTVSINVTVTNSGVESAEASIMRFYLSSDSLVSEGDLIFEEVAAIPELAVGGQVNLEESLGIPEEFEEGIYYIIASADDDDIVWENDELNNVSSNEITILSDIPPVITATDFPEFRVEGLDNTIIKIQAEDDVEIGSVNFKYKGIRSAVWDSTAVNLKDGYYQVSIPGAIFDELGLEYYFEVFDDVGLKAESEIGFTYIKYPDKGILLDGLTYGKNQSDYQIVSIPLDLNQNDIETIFEDDLGPYNTTKWRLFSYENGNFKEYGEGSESPKKMDLGKGYWLIVRDDQNVFTGEGSTVKANQNQLYEITLNKGWNQIGNPYNFDFKWSDVLSENGFPSGISGDIKVFEDGFKSTDVLKSFQGGFVQANTRITLKIPITKEIIPSGRQTTLTGGESTKDWYVGLAIGNGIYKHEINGFGMSEVAKDGMDALDETHLPAFGFLSNLAVNFNHAQLDDFVIAKDIVSLKEEHIWNLEIKNESADQYVYLSWEIPELTEDDKQLFLYNTNNGVKVNMLSNPGIWIDTKNANDLKIIYGDDEFLEKSSLSAEVVLGGGYPNPFSNTTKIPVALPTNSPSYDVHLGVYNSLGQNVKTLMQGQYTGGLYEIEWDGNNEAGTKVKPGIYIYQLKVSNNDQDHSIYGRLVFE